MLNYEEELRKFKPSLEVDQIEEAVYKEDLTDMQDIVKRGYGKERKNGEKIGKIVVGINGLHKEDHVSVKFLVQ